LSFQ